MRLLVVVPALAIFVIVLAGLEGSRMNSHTSSRSATVDHIVYAAPELDAGIGEIERLTGVRAQPGGSHPGVGTRNALLSLGPNTYLEIIAPDPAQNLPPRIFGMNKLTRPKLVAWAARRTELEQLVRKAAEQQINLEPVRAGSRKRPDGVTLSWKTTGLPEDSPEFIVPFFIDWRSSPHPARTATPGLRLVSLRAQHPHPENIQSVLRALGVELDVAKADEPALIAVLEGPRGRVELR